MDFNLKSEKEIFEYISKKSPKEYKITIGLIVVCIIFYFLQLFFDFKEHKNYLIELFWLSNTDINNGEYWRFFTSIFTHGNTFHLLNNILCLFVYGKCLEIFLSRKKYIVFLLFTLFITNIVVYIDGSPTIGISGIVYSIIGFLFIKSFINKIKFDRIFFSIIVLVSLFDTFFRDNISISGHLSGLLSGIIFYLILLLINNIFNKKSKYSL